MNPPIVVTVPLRPKKIVHSAKDGRESVEIQKKDEVST